MMRLPIVFFVLLAPFLLHAQVPGYMGRKFSIGIGAGIENAGNINLITYFSKSYYKDHTKARVKYDGTAAWPFAVNFRPGVHAEYVVSRTAAISAAFQQFKFGMYRLNSGTDSSSYYNAKSNALRIGICWSKKGYIMPHGRYRAFYLGMVNSIVSRIQDNKVTSETTVLNFNVSYDMGARKIFFDRLILDYSYGFGLNFGDFKAGNEVVVYHNYMDLVHVNVNMRYLLF